ncbi:carbohydrate sulfotransferase 11-like, partial [Amblyomma americanum]
HTHRCRPCSIKYDVIVKVETLDSDFEKLLSRLGLAGWKLPKRNAKSPRNKSQARKAFARHFSELTREQVLKLFAIYVYDFELYGYRLEGYTSPVL